MICRNRLPLLPALVAFVGLLAFGAPRVALAQDVIPGRLPRIIFLIEDSDDMLATWQGGGTYTESRWHYVREAIASVLRTAPGGLDVAITMSPNGMGDEPQGFERVAGFNLKRSTTIQRLYVQGSNMGGSYRAMGAAFAGLTGQWFDQPRRGNAVWHSPFEEDCDEMHVIVIGSGKDVQRSLDMSVVSNSPQGEHSCGALSGGSGGRPGGGPGSGGGGSSSTDPSCALDNAVHYAYSTYVNRWGAHSVIKTHTILVDSTVADPDAEPTYRAAASFGGPNAQFFAADKPEAIHTAIWSALNASIQGEYSNGGVTVSPRGDRIFSTYFTVLGGFPLDTGHLLAFDLENDEGATNFGEIVPGLGPLGSRYDAGELLSLRPVQAGERNQNGFNPARARNGYIPKANASTFSEFMPFDEAGISQGDLADILVDLTPASQNPQCLALENDYDYDCDVDQADAQEMVDFIRGVPTVYFLNSTIQRGTWRLGNAGHSRPVYAPAHSATVATSPSFAAYQSKLRAKQSMVYLASNAGMIHGFEADSGQEMWFVVPRAKATWDYAAANEYEDHRVQDLRHLGQTDINSGRLNLQHVWMDGYLTDLPGCNGPAYDPSARDGKADPDGCEWHRVIVWAGGYGARHIYAVDVSNPESPRFLFERTDDSAGGQGQGRATGVPAVGSFLDKSSGTAQMRWLTVHTSGPQGPEAGLSRDKRDWAHASLYVDDIESGAAVPTQYPEEGLRVPVPGLSNEDSDRFLEYDPATTEGLFGTPSLADLDSDGSIDVGYFGDSLGNLFKVNFVQGRPGNPEVCHFASASSSDSSLSAYNPPAVFYDGQGRLNVWWSTGGPYDREDQTRSGGLYARVDPAPYGCAASVPAQCAAGSTLFDTDGYYSFTGTGEKTVGSPTVRGGQLLLGTYVRGTDACDVGTSRLYGFDVERCEGALYDAPGDAYTVQNNLYAEIGGLISEPVFANDRLYTLKIDGTTIGASDLTDDFVVRPPHSAPEYFVSRREY